MTKHNEGVNLFVFFTIHVAVANLMILGPYTVVWQGTRNEYYLQELQGQCKWAEEHS